MLATKDNQRGTKARDVAGIVDSEHGCMKEVCMADGTYKTFFVHHVHGPPDRRVFISCIPNFISREWLCEVITKEFGKICDLFYLADSAQGDRGFAFVRFRSIDDAHKFVINTNGRGDFFCKQIRPVHVKYSTAILNECRGTVFDNISYDQPVTPWSEHESEDSGKFYYNSFTGQSQWEIPSDLLQPTADSAMRELCEAAKEIERNGGIGGGSITLDESLKGVAGNSKCGPQGCNLFVFHIPNSWTDEILARIFSPFGELVSARIQVDNTSNVAKGYGFVSYARHSSALEAIKHMQGFDTRTGKNLQVSIKKGEESFHPNAAELAVATAKQQQG